MHRADRRRRRRRSSAARRSCAGQEEHDRDSPHPATRQPVGEVGAAACADRVALPEALTDQRGGGGSDGEAAEEADALQADRDDVGRPGDVGRVEAVDHHDDRELRDPGDQVLDARRQPDGRMRCIVCQCGRRRCEVQPDLALPAEEHEELQHAAEDVGADRPDRDPLEAQFRQPERAAASPKLSTALVRSTTTIETAGVTVSPCAAEAGVGGEQDADGSVNSTATSAAFARPVSRGMSQACGSASLWWYTDRWHEELQQLLPFPVSRR